MIKKLKKYTLAKTTWAVCSSISKTPSNHLLTSIMIKIDDRDNGKYASVEYWNDRYKTEREYDWLGDYNRFKHLINKYVDNKQAKILMVGCGNSTLSQSMFLDGYTNIISTDISEVCIQNQKLALPHLQWEVADITNLHQFKDGQFDAVIEKATLDALLVEEKSPWHPSDEAKSMMDSSLSEISRVLKSKQGIFLSLTFAQPHFREPFYAKEKYGWSVRSETFGSSFSYYCYVMTLGEPLDDQVYVTTSVGISKLMINNNDNEKSSDSVSGSSDDEDFTSRIDFSLEEDDALDQVDPLPMDNLNLNNGCNGVASDES